MSSGKARGSGGRRKTTAARHAAEATGRKRVAPKRQSQNEAPVEAAIAAARKPARTALLVLGMHRSGTSLLAGVLQRLGATWPKTLIAPNASNPKGYGESVAFMRAHDRLLTSAGSSWSDWAPFNPDWAESPIADQFAEELWTVFEQEYGDAHLVVMKDPRACRFAGFWIELLKARDVRPMPLITVRNPLEVAASLNRRDRMPTTLGLLLWLRHVIDAERATRGMPRAFVNYDDVLDDWRQAVADIRSRLGVKWPRYSRSIELEIDDWVDQSLHREIAPARAALSRQDVAEWVRRIYAALLQISKDGESQAVLKVFDAVGVEFDKSSAVFGVLTKNLENIASTASAEAERLTVALASLSQRERTIDAKANKFWRDFELEHQRADKLTGELSVAIEKAKAADQRAETHSKDLAAAIERAKAAEGRAAAAEAKARIADEKTAELSAVSSKLLLSETLAKTLEQRFATATEAAKSADARAMKLAADLEVAAQKNSGSESRIEALIRDLSEAADAVKDAGVDLRALTGERDAQRKRADDLSVRIATLEPNLQKVSAELKSVTDAAKARESDIAKMKEIFEATLASRDRDIARLENALTLARSKADDAETHLRALSEQYAMALEALSESPADALSRATLEAELARAEEARAHEVSLARVFKEQVGDLERALKGARDRIYSLETAFNTVRGSMGPIPEVAPLSAGGIASEMSSQESAIALIRAAMFDERHYAQQLKKRGLSITGDPIEHYLAEGAGMGLNPHPEFDTVWYLRANIDVARTGLNPLVHFLRYGKSEGRSANPKLDLNASTYHADRPYLFAPAQTLNQASAQYMGARKAGAARVAFFTAITGGYDEISMHEHLDPSADYHLFLDVPLEGRYIYNIRPAPYFDTDPVRAARFVKTHPHMLFADYEIAVWVDGNVLVRGDLTADIEAFRKSGLAVAAIPHPLRTNVYEEAEECGKRSKDDVAVMQQQMRRYLDAGFDGAGLIESNFMMFRIGHPKLAEFLDTWWAEIEKGSRRDQLSLSYALHASGTTAFPLAQRPHSVRNHKSLALFHHGSLKRPVDEVPVLARLAPPVAESYAHARERRISAQRNRKIDVVVCVHNALDVVKLCLESVARTRKPERHRIVIINDGSDEETSGWLAQFAAAHPNTKLIRREKAGGYTKAANAGLRELKGDMAILLNSDTIASANWIEKMADAVFSNAGAGIVGPMSSAASTQSLPDHKSTATQTAINDLPPGFSVDDMNRWCEENSPADFVPRVPLVHGFCFGLTREVIERVGYFDGEHFPYGYGEENDYCMRAVNAGFSLVIATHTYVYHKKSQSYEGERRAGLMKAGNQKIRDLHGEARVKRAVMAMQQNPYLERLRRLSLGLFPPAGGA
ncbi:MAG TPA: glycosyltransferase [Hyphomonadaceae bacterium]|nr:glycosyltransferase [Hyphomonadaceae bacterium]